MILLGAASIQKYTLESPARIRLRAHSTERVKNYITIKSSLPASNPLPFFLQGGSTPKKYSVMCMPTPSILLLINIVHRYLNKLCALAEVNIYMYIILCNLCQLFGYLPFFCNIGMTTPAKIIANIKVKRQLTATQMNIFLYVTYGMVEKVLSSPKPFCNLCSLEQYRVTPAKMKKCVVLRSAVGKTHVLRSRLVMIYTTSHFPLIVLGYPLDSKRYSEIDQIHLSSDAQCVSHHLPQVDCHSTIILWSLPMSDIE